MISTKDTFIASSTIKDNQCTISWYVYDNKVSHIDESVNTKLIQTISENFGILAEYIGKKHRFLVMDFEFSADGKV